MANAIFYTLTKRKNSTLQPTGSGTTIDVNLKSGTSFISPTFLLNISGPPAYNYVEYEGRYYFVTDIVSVRNDLWEIHCEVDVLATYKTAITSSTQYVSYSSAGGSAWLPDNRIAVEKNATVAKNTTTMNFLFTAGGFYVMSVIGKQGCDVWALDATKMGLIMDRITDWADDIIDDVLNANYPWSTNPLPSPYDFTTVEDALESFGKMNALTGVVGNAYNSAPDCIRSCIWVPFFISNFIPGNLEEIYLGQFPTNVFSYKCKTDPLSNSVTVNIPWQYSDWRRSVCEDVYLYLPLVGLIALSSDSIINESSLTIEWSVTATDGNLAYCVKAGNQIVGTFGANAAINYPVGVSQQASLGENITAFLAGMEKLVTIGARSTVSPLSASTAAIGMRLEGTIAAYELANSVYTRHNSCIGGIGGGAGIGLDLDATCFTVAHPTNISPSAMQATMGLPTMKPMSLSTLSGFCQCANAHVAIDGTDTEMNLIDKFINSGFYIE